MPDKAEPVLQLSRLFIMGSPIPLWSNIGSVIKISVNVALVELSGESVPFVITLN